MKGKDLKQSKESGYTLIEIMLAVTILGLLAAISMPAFKRIKQSSQNTRLLSDLRTFGDQALTYTLTEGDFPEDSSSGVIPAGFDDYIRPRQWQAGPPIGSVFDVEKDSYGVVSAVGVHGYSGLYRKLASDRYYLFIAE